MNEITLSESQIHKILWEISELKIENKALTSRIDTQEMIQEIMERRLAYLIELIKDKVKE